MVRLLAVPVLLAGSATAYAAVLVHARWWGLLLGLAACACVLVALPGRWWGRPAFAVGWALVVALGALPRAEGDYLVAADTLGYTLLVATLVAVMGALVTLAGGRVDPGDRPGPT
jgi:hypothetical protein